MYEIQIKIEEKINEFTIEELKDLKEVLKFFKDYDEFHMKYVKSDKGGEEKMRFMLGFVIGLILEFIIVITALFHMDD